MFMFRRLPYQKALTFVRYVVTETKNIKRRWLQDINSDKQREPTSTAKHTLCAAIIVLIQLHRDSIPISNAAIFTVKYIITEGISSTLYYNT
jgi:hypothetical protein